MASYQNFNESPATFEFYPELLMTAGDGSVWWDFGDETTMFADLSMTVPITTSGQNVAVVLDKGPTGIPLFQGETARQPTFIIDGDQKFLRFDGPSCNILTTGSAVELALQSCRGFTAVRGITGESYQRILSIGKAGIGNDQTGTGTMNLNSHNNSGLFNMRALAAALDSYVNGSGVTTLGLYEYGLDGANSAKTWRNGVAGLADSSHSALALKSLGCVGVGGMIANNNQSLTSPFNGDIYGIMHFARELTPGDISAIRTWWNTNRL